MLLDNLKDIIKHTHGLGFITDIKIYNDEEGVTRVESIAEDRTVVIYGSLAQPIESVIHEIGLHRIAVLDGYINFPPFQTSDASITIEEETRQGEAILSEIKFDSKEGHVAHYRFMGPQAVEQIKIPAFKGASWDVVVEPSSQNMNHLKYFNNVLGQYEAVFTPRVIDGTLCLNIGSGASDRSTIPFANGVDGDLKTPWSYPLARVLSILKLSESSNCTMSFSDKGALKIQLDSGLGRYEYIVPAKAN